MRLVLGINRGRRLLSLILFSAVFVVASGGILAPSTVVAQEDDYEEWLQQQEEEYEAYLSEQDKAFLEFLEKEWTDVSVDPRASSPIDDKPQEIPRVDGATGASPQGAPPDPQRPSNPDPPSPPDNPSEESSFDDEPMGEDDEPFDDPDDPFADPSEEEGRDPFSEEEMEESTPGPSGAERQSPQGRDVSSVEAAEIDQQTEFSFFGASSLVPYGHAIVPQLEGAPDESSIQQFWKTMAEAPYSPTLEELQKQRSELTLSDWGYYLYLRNLGAQLYGDGSREDVSMDATLWTWFMMMKSGYGVRVGYREDDVFLMLPVNEQVFNRPQMQIDGQRYYLMTSETGGSLRTYEGDHPEADRILRLDEGTVPNVSATSETRSVSFSFQDERHELDIAYNPAVVDYLEAYLNVELNVLFRSGVSTEARQSLVDALDPLVEGRSIRDAVNLLLTFAQFSTEYKRDRDHFGEERFLFPEETLAFDYSDCEDRAVLLSYLVRTLLDREVVGLRWPRHVALAIRAGEGLEVSDSDRHITVNGETYIYADPTYIGSSLGMEMPIVEGNEPEIIDL